MKKLISLILALIMILSFSACEENEEQEDPGNSDSGAETEKLEKPPVKFEKIVLTDDSNSMIAITEIEPDNSSGFIIKIVAENRSETDGYKLSIYDSTVNGVQYKNGVTLSKELEPLEKGEYELCIQDPIFEEIGITLFTDIRLHFHFSKTDYMSSTIHDYRYDNEIHIYPYGEDKATQFVREDQPGDIVLFDNQYIKCIIIGTENDRFFGYSLKYFFVNKTDSNVDVTLDDGTVNGLSASNPSTFLDVEYICNAACAFGSITGLGEIINEHGITSVEEIKMFVNAYPSSDMSMMVHVDYFKDTVTFKP